MSQMATEQPSSRSGGGAMSALTRKIGPLPMWGWMGIGLALALVYFFFTKNKQASSSSTAATADTTSASQIPQFVNQTYVTTTPPVASTPPTTTTGSGTGTTSGGTGTTGSGTTRPTSYTATGVDTGDINRIAQSFGLTEAELIAANPGLKKVRVKDSKNGKEIPLIGSGAPVPAGTKLTIPPVPTTPNKTS
jgi:hypothetical protein